MIKILIIMTTNNLRQSNLLQPNNNKSQSNKWNLYQLIWKLFYQ
jgi:hypothetical protein